MLAKTICFPLDIDSNIILPMMEISRQIFNQHVDWAYENKSYNKVKAHHELYHQLREQFPNFPSAIIQTTRDVALEAVKHSKFKTKKPRKKSSSSIRYGLTTMTLRGEQLTFSTLNKRHKIILNIPEYCSDVVDNWNFKGGTICYKTKQFFLKLVFQTTEPEKTEISETVGIDRGLYNLAVLSDGTIFNSKKVRDKQRTFLYNRKKLQAKCTPSAKRKLKKLSGKEKRFSQDFNHCMSKKIVNMEYGTFVLEDLKGIRKQKFSKKLNKWISSWTFSQFENFLFYKAKELGKNVVKVDARYTSQKCSCCGMISKENRSKSKYKCSKCGYFKHADINAAINIKNNFLSSLNLNSTEEQAAVNQPIVSSYLPIEIQATWPCARSS